MLKVIMPAKTAVTLVPSTRRRRAAIAVAAAAALGGCCCLEACCRVGWGRAACVFDAFFALLNLGDPPLLFTLVLNHIRPVLSALFGNRGLVTWWSVRGGVWRPAGKVKAIDTAKRLEDHPMYTNHAQRRTPDSAPACGRRLDPGREGQWWWYLTPGR